MKRKLAIVVDSSFGLAAPFGGAGEVQDEFFAAALKDSLQLCQNLQFGPGCKPPDLLLAYSGARDFYARIAPQYCLLVPQMGMTLAQVLDNLLIFLGPEPDDETLIIGPRTPHLGTQALQRAFACVQEQGACLGATPSGQVYAIGFRGRWPAGVLGRVRWDAPQAARDVQQAFKRLHVQTALLEKVESLQDSGQVAGVLAAIPDCDATGLVFLRQLVRKLGMQGAL